MSKQYKGKWVSKDDSEESGIAMVDVISVEGNEVKAIGRNMTLTELLSNYIPLSESKIQIPDPFAVPLGADSGYVDNEDNYEAEKAELNLASENTVSPPLAAQWPVATNAFVEPEEPKKFRKYTPEENAILSMLNIIKTKKNQHCSISLNLTLNLDFDLIKFVTSAENMGFDSETVQKIVSEECINSVDSDNLSNMIEKSLTDYLNQPQCKNDDN